MKRFRIVPCSLADANAFVAKHHRHASTVRGHKFSIALELCSTTAVVGVAIVGRPIARFLQDGWTLEVLRNCTDGTNNACSALYGAACRASFALGYRRVVTYTGKSESGASLRGAGFRIVAEVRGSSWDRPSRPRVKAYPLIDKLRWEVGGHS